MRERLVRWQPLGVLVLLVICAATFLGYGYRAGNETMMALSITCITSALTIGTVASLILLAPRLPCPQCKRENAVNTWMAFPI